jgi:N-acetyl-anhydromuramyl-L-alanine amidase AmpD
MAKKIENEHLRSTFWTQIWHLKDKDPSGKFNYYKGLTLKERQHLTDVLTDALEAERQVIFGEDYKPAIVSTGSNPTHASAAVSTAKKEEIHSSSLYLFGEKKLWIPWAKTFDRGAKRGDYADKYPKGLVVHWTAGHRNGLTSGFSVMRSGGHLYLMIDQDGNLGQTNPLNEWGEHAGKSAWTGLTGRVSQYLVGVELQAAGELTPHDGGFYPWWDRKKDANGNYTGPHQFLAKNRFPPEEVKYSAKKDNIAAGYYHIYTDKQLATLRKLIAWLHLNNPSVFSLDRVVGHDEVSPGRKVDPGASLVLNGKVLTMPEFRQLCKDDVKAIQAAK